MSRINYKILGLLFIASGILIIGRGFGFIPEIFAENLGVINIALGMLIVVFTIGRNSRLALFVGGVVFISGVQQFTAANFEILNTQFLTAPVILFAAGTGFLLLFIDNTKVKIFLTSSILLFIFGYLTVLLHQQISELKILNRFAGETLELWPLFFVLIGLSLLVRDRK